MTVAREVKLTELEVAYLDAETALRGEIERRGTELLQRAQALSQEAMALEDQAKKRAAKCLARLAANHGVAGGFPSTSDLLRRGDEVTFRWNEEEPGQAELGSADVDNDAPTPIDGTALPATLDKPCEPAPEPEPVEEAVPEAAEEARA